MILVCLALGTSAQMQIHMNSLEYFTYHNLEAAFSGFKDERIDRYFKEKWHRGTIHRDLMDHARGKAAFPPLIVTAYITAPDNSALIQKLEYRLAELASLNYLFLLPPPRENPDNQPPNTSENRR